MSAQVKDPLSPATTSCAYDAMRPRWQLIETLLGGTEAMRAAGEVYLPRHVEETQQGYDERLRATVLLNMVEQTLDTLVGKPFSEPIKVNEDVPEQIKSTVLEDVDLQGNNIDVFSRQWFREGFAKAFAHVLVDMPRPEPREDGRPRTLADDRREGVRPYWVLIKPECVLFAQATVINGVETLQHVRILECYTERVGFAEVIKRRIRILEPGRVELWVPVERKTAQQKEEWRKDDEWATGLDYIPFVTFYADREDFMLGKPPLEDQAHLNVAHWQSTSDQRHCLTVARFPILACSGATAEDSDPVVVGPNKVLYNPDPQGKFYYVEHQGTAIKAGDKDLENLERQMAQYGAEFLKAKPGNPTATARALDSAESTSDLASMVGKFEDALAQVLYITADWMRITGGDKKGGTVELVKDYDLEEMDTAGLELLKFMREKRDLSRKALIQAAKLLGVLPEDFDEEADWQELMDEMSQILGKSGLDLDPGQKDLPPGTKLPKPSPQPGGDPDDDEDAAEDVE